MKPLISTLALLAFMGTAQAQTFQWDINIEHYTIKGESGEALMAQMEKRGPHLKDKPLSDRAWAASFIKFVNGTYSPCFMRMHVDIIMPRWLDYDKASPTSQVYWDKFYADVMKHEMTHVGHYKAQEDFIKANKCNNKAIIQAFERGNKLGEKFDAIDHGIPPEITNIQPYINPVADAPIPLLTD